MESMFDAYRTDPELTIRLSYGVLLKVAKVGGGTLFKEYAGQWIVEVSITDDNGYDGIIQSTILHNPSEINHRDALRQYAQSLTDESNDFLDRDSAIWETVNDFIVHDEYEIV